MPHYETPEPPRRFLSFSHFAAAIWRHAAITQPNTAASADAADSHFRRRY